LKTRIKSYILLLLLICFSNISTSQVLSDTSLNAISDSKKIEALTKSLKGQISSVNDATKKVQKSLIGKIAAFFKFSSNFKESEKKRVIEIVSSLGIEDSINLSESKIKALILQLSVRENQHYDTLLKLISDLKIVDKPIGISTNEDAEIIPEQTNNSEVKDKDVDDLTTKILSIVTKKATESEEDKKRNERLSEIRKINSRRDSVQIIVDSARDVVRKFVVKSFNKVKVIGFHNYNQKTNINELNLTNYNNIIYNGVFVDNITGHIKDLNDWDVSEIMNTLDKYNAAFNNFEKKKIKPILNIIFSANSDFSNFILNNLKQENLIADLQKILPLHKNTEGICLQIDQPDLVYKKQITEFIINLSIELKKINPSYNLYLIIPPAISNPVFEYALINPYVNYYIIDFYSVSKNPLPFPIAPIKGKELTSIESTFSYYTNNHIPSSKIILGLSYQGLKWSYNSKTQNFKFIQPLTYSEIRNRYNWPIVYNSEFGTAFMDSVNARGELVRRIYFEDEFTLSKKYDFVTQNELAGVSLFATNFDYGYGELNDLIVYKLAYIDTLYLQDSIIKKNVDPSFFERFKMRWQLYYYVLNHPCMVCFDNISDLEQRALVFHCIYSLKWDIEAAKLKISRFQFVTYKLYTLALEILGIFFLISCILSFLYYKRMKEHGDDIHLGGGKSLYVFNLISWFIVILSFILLLFTSDKFSYFGVYNTIDTNKIISLPENSKPVPLGATQPSTVNSNDNQSTKSEAATEQPNESANSTNSLIKTNVERTASNDAISQIKNKYLNSSLRISQNSYFRNQSNSGSNNSNKNTDIPDSSGVQLSSITSKDLAEYKNDSYCISEFTFNTSECINIPFRTIFLVLLIAIFVGILFDIFFIRKLTQKNEIP
jgi:spore germination protein YaaH